MKKERLHYFDAFAKQATYAQELTLNLRSGIQAGELGEKSLVDALHVMENDADSINHLIQEHLVADFTVPMDRGDMNILANALDDVCDGVEEVAIRAYIRKVGSLPEGGNKMIDCLVEGVSAIANAVTLLKDTHSKTDDITAFCIEAQAAESRCDKLFLASARKVTESGNSFEERFSAMDMLNAVEDAMDTVEAAAEALERVVTSAI